MDFQVPHASPRLQDPPPPTSFQPASSTARSVRAATLSAPASAALGISSFPGPPNLASRQPPLSHTPTRAPPTPAALASVATAQNGWGWFDQPALIRSSVDHPPIHVPSPASSRPTQAEKRKHAAVEGTTSARAMELIFKFSWPVSTIAFITGVPKESLYAKERKGSAGAQTASVEEAARMQAALSWLLKVVCAPPFSTEVLHFPGPSESRENLRKMMERVEGTRTSIDLCVYLMITHPDSADALIRVSAKPREVQIRLITNYAHLNCCNSEVRYNKYLTHTQHQKYCIVDPQATMAGSANWSKNAFKNGETVEIRDGDIISTQSYERHFWGMWRHNYIDAKKGFCVL